MPDRQPSTGAATVLGLALVAAGACGGSSAGGPGAHDASQARVTDPGDPLPEGALVRFGTVRLRQCDQVTAVAVAPDGSWVGAADRAGCVRAWSTEDGSRLASHRLDVPDGAVALAASRDGRLLAVAGGDGSVLVLEAEGGRVVSRGQPFEAPAAELRFLPGAGALVAVSQAGGRLAVLEVGGDQLTERWARDVQHLAQVYPSPDGSQLLGVSGRLVRVLDARDGTERASFSLGGARTPRVGRFVPGGDGFAVASDESIHLLDAAGRETGRINIGFPAGVVADLEARGESPTIRDLAFVEPDTMVVLPNDGTLRLVDVHGNERRRFEHGLDARSVRVSPESHLAVLSAPARKPHLIDLSTGRSPLSFEAHDGAVRSLAVSPDGAALATAGDDGFVWLWSARDGRPVASLEAGRPVDSVIFVGPQRIASGDRSGELTLWRADGTAVQHVATEGAGDSSHAVRSLTANREGTLLVSTNSDHVQFWEHSPERSTPLVEQLDFDVQGCDVVALSPDGQTVAASSESQKLLRYRPATEREQRSLGPWVEEEWGAHDDALRGIAWSPEGERVATVGADRRLRIWADDGETLAAMEAGAPLLTVAWSPDGDLLAVGRDDGVVELWSTRGHPSAAVAVLAGHEGAVDALTFSPDGRVLYSASEDETALGWDVASVRRTRQGAAP